MLKNHAINMSGEVQIKFHAYCDSDMRILSMSKVSVFLSPSYYEPETHVDLLNDTKQPV